MERLLRPYGVVVDGTLELGLELLLEGDCIREIRPHTGIPETFVVSTAFVNAHSHLEYRGLQDVLESDEYWPWIREITLAKRSQDATQVREDVRLAAFENRKTGVAAIAEHSDRWGAGEAFAAESLTGVLFQEVLTRFEASGPGARLERAIADCRAQAALAGVPGFLALHAYHTVDEGTLSAIGGSGEPFSMHVGESEFENALTRSGDGVIADALRSLDVPFHVSGERLIPTLDALGLVRKGAQFVHCCALDEEEALLLAARQVSVAHCPRSNRRLSCPPAPIREMLDAGVEVGLGLDSPASSGPIDMFAEMVVAFEAATERGRPISPEEVWRMATSGGARSLAPFTSIQDDWDVYPGSRTPLIMIHVNDAYTVEDLMRKATPERVEWVASHQSA